MTTTDWICRSETHVLEKLKGLATGHASQKTDLDFRNATGYSSKLWLKQF